MMTKRRSVAVLSLGALLACGAGDVPVEQVSDLTFLLPDASDLDGWVVAEGPVEHAPETLYEYINGGADRYLAHGFEKLLHVRYQLGDDQLASVTLDVYDMGSELGAFGIFSAARAPGVEIRPWGAEGYRVGTIAAAWKGPVYLHGEADDERPGLINKLESLMAGACENIPGEALPPSVLENLPAEGRVVGSERYVPANLLGHSFLPGGVFATYEIEGERSELYLSALGSESAAVDALEKLRTHFSELGSVEDQVASLGDAAFRYVDPTLDGGTAVRAGNHVVGIHGELDADAREGILGVACEHMR